MAYATLPAAESNKHFLLNKDGDVRTTGNNCQQEIQLKHFRQTKYQSKEYIELYESEDDVMCNSIPIEDVNTTEHAFSSTSMTETSGVGYCICQVCSN